MITDEKVARINELARKAKTPEGLTDLERAEQARLRQEYIAAFRASTLAALKNVSVQEADGSIRPLIPEDKDET